ncbi:hypothetical protein [Amycolatopsis orientalis]|uniref:hypothetical protein n=1 Tax=Amycolatopsis orientalis TaxID=31958 RepID=UPI0013790872|nr:hypothetical protein [Amycolatopsis orientalis]
MVLRRTGLDIRVLADRYLPDARIHHDREDATRITQPSRVQIDSQGPGPSIPLRDRVPDSLASDAGPGHRIGLAVDHEPGGNDSSHHADLVDQFDVAVDDLRTKRAGVQGERVTRPRLRRAQDEFLFEPAVGGRQTQVHVWQGTGIGHTVRSRPRCCGGGVLKGVSQCVVAVQTDTGHLSGVRERRETDGCRSFTRGPPAIRARLQVQIDGRPAPIGFPDVGLPGVHPKSAAAIRIVERLSVRGAVLRPLDGLGIDRRQPASLVDRRLDVLPAVDHALDLRRRGGRVGHRAGRTRSVAEIEARSFVSPRTRPGSQPLLGRIKRSPQRQRLDRLGVFDRRTGDRKQNSQHETENQPVPRSIDHT